MVARAASSCPARRGTGAGAGGRRRPARRRRCGPVHSANAATSAVRLAAWPAHGRSARQRTRRGPSRPTPLHGTAPNLEAGELSSRRTLRGGPYRSWKRRADGLEIRSTDTAGGNAAAAAGFAGASTIGWDGIAGATTNGPGRNGVTKAKPKKGGSLVFGVDAEEQGFDPTTGRFDEVGVMYARTVFDPLTIVLTNGDWAPYLAESVVPNSSYTSWEITLRPNVTFHDGTACDGATLVTNLQAQAKSLLTGIVLSPTLVSISRPGRSPPPSPSSSRGCRSPTTWPAGSAGRSPTSSRPPCSPTRTARRTRSAPGPSCSRSGSPTTTSPRRPTRTTGARACPTSRRSRSSRSPTNPLGPRRSSPAPST